MKEVDLLRTEFHKVIKARGEKVMSFIEALDKDALHYAEACARLRNHMRIYDMAQYPE